MRHLPPTRIWSDRYAHSLLSGSPALSSSYLLSLDPSKMHVSLHLHQLHLRDRIRRPFDRIERRPIGFVGHDHRNIKHRDAAGRALVDEVLDS